MNTEAQHLYGADIGGRAKRGKKSPYRYIPKKWLSLTKNHTFLRRLLFSPVGRYSTRKGITGFIFGCVLAVMIGELLIDQMPLYPEMTFYLRVVTLVVLSTSNSISSQARCLSLLLIPTIITKSGVFFLKSVMMALVIAGPVENLLVNAREVVNSMSCTAELLNNLTLIKYKHTLLPYQQALMNLKVDVNEVVDTVGSVREVIAPLTREILDDSEIRFLKEQNDHIDDILGNSRKSKETDDRYNGRPNSSFWASWSTEDLIRPATGLEKKVESEIAAAVEDLFMRKFEYRCNNVISGAIKKCLTRFKTAYEICCNSLPVQVASLLCWPMRISYVCNMIHKLGSDLACDSSRDMSRGWGRGVVTLLKTKQVLTQHFRSPEVKYRVNPPELHLDADQLREQAGDLKLRFEEYSAWYLKVMNLMQIAMNLIFFKVIYDVFDYRQRYLTNIEFENVYVSRLFQKIDARRHACKKQSLLPFKNREKHQFIFPNRLALQSTEIKSAGYGLIILSPLFFFITAIVLIDRAFTEALDIVSRNALIEFVSTGYEDMKFGVSGTGIIARIVKSVVGGFNFKQKQREIHNNEDCLPTPHFLKNSNLFGIYGVLLTCAVFVVSQGYGSRLKWTICEFFFPKRAKKRTLFLYNDTLKKRKVFFKYMNTKVRRLIRENKLDQDTSTVLLLSMKYPNYFGWLSKFFHQARRKCLICRVPEDVGLFRNDVIMFECQTCLYVYCKECYNDVGRRCHRCRPLSIDDDSDPESVLAKSDQSD